MRLAFGLFCRLSGPSVGAPAWGSNRAARLLPGMARCRRVIFSGEASTAISMGERSKSPIKYGEICPGIRCLGYGIARSIKPSARMSCEKDIRIALDAMCIHAKTSIVLILNTTATAKQFPAGIACGAWDFSSAWDRKMSMESSTIAARRNSVSTNLNILSPWACLPRYDWPTRESVANPIGSSLFLEAKLSGLRFRVPDNPIRSRCGKDLDKDQFLAILPNRKWFFFLR